MFDHRTAGDYAREAFTLTPKRSLGLKIQARDHERSI